ncbi:hypothetical protein [Brevundimonas lutea]|uniref:hypothetical protein n=1 Tax=Brevundimonas lutea TaxID=2293980 RepID=UPI000F019EF2|nr:hypothetical protein [Brevundimonas lutea]
MTAERPLLPNLIGGLLLLAALTVAAVGGLLARDPDLFSGLALPSLPKVEAPAILDTRRTTGPDGLTQGLFRPEGEGPVLTFDAAGVAWGDAEPFRTAPHRILTGDDRWNGQGGRLSGLFDIPRDAQVELRRITEGEAPACADGAPGRWLAVSHEGPTVVVAVFSGEQPPGPEGSPARLCALARVQR